MENCHYKAKAKAIYNTAKSKTCNRIFGESFIWIATNATHSRNDKVVKLQVIFNYGLLQPFCKGFAMTNWQTLSFASLRENLQIFVAIYTLAYFYFNNEILKRDSALQIATHFCKMLAMTTN